MSDEKLDKRACPKLNGMGCKLSPLVREGKIVKIEGMEEIAKIPGVISIHPSYREGETVKGLGTLKQIVCRFFVVSDNKEQLKRTLEQIYKNFNVIDEYGNSMLLAPFDTNIILEKY